MWALLTVNAALQWKRKYGTDFLKYVLFLFCVFVLFFFFLFFFQLLIHVSLCKIKLYISLIFKKLKKKTHFLDFVHALHIAISKKKPMTNVGLWDI